METRFVYNTLNKSVSCQVFGSWFTLKPLQIKAFNPEMGDFLCREKGYMGLVDLPQEFDDPSYKETEEGKALLESKRQEGINKRVQYLQRQVNNLQVSLKTDMEMKNIKADPLLLATDGDMNAMRELKELQREGDDKQKKRLEEARKLSQQLHASSSAPFAKKD